MSINEKLKQLYNRYDFLIDCDRWVQAKTVQNEIKEILINVARKLKSASWKQIYLVPFGPAVLSMNIKMLVYKILYVETIDILHLGNGVHVDIDINTRDISISSEK